MKYRAIILSVFIVFGGVSCQNSTTKKTVIEPELRQGYFLTEEAAREQLLQFSETYSNQTSHDHPQVLALQMDDAITRGLIER